MFMMEREPREWRREEREKDIFLLIALTTITLIDRCSLHGGTKGGWAAQVAGTADRLPCSVK